MPPISEILYCLVIFGVTAAECLLAVWAATSSWPRLVRAVVVWLAIVPLIPIEAYWPALFFSVNAVATVLIIALTRAMLRARPAPGATRSRGNLTISHLLILTLAIGTALALCVHFRLTGWQGALAVVVLALPLAPLCAFAHSAAVGTAQRKATIASVAYAFVSASLLLWMDVGQNLRLNFLIGPRPARNELHWHLLTLGCLATSLVLLVWVAIQISRKPPQAWKRILYLLTLGISACGGVLLACRYIDDLWHNGLTLLWYYGPDWLAIWSALIALALVVAGASRVQLALQGQPAPLWARLARGVALTAPAVLALPAGWIYWQMLWPPQFSAAPAGGANHYDRLFATGRQLADRQRALIRPLPAVASPELDEAMSLLMTGSSSIPVRVLEGDLAGDYQRTIRHHDVWALGGPLTELRDQTAGLDRGADYALALVRLETMLHRGGITAHANMARNLCTRNEQWLADHVEGVSIDKAREIVRVLERSLAERDDPAILRDRDRVYWSRSGGWASRLKIILRNRPVELGPTGDVDQIHAANLALRGLAVLYAVRLFQHDHDRVPHNLAELTPHYLERVPIDPYSGRPLVYRDHDRWHGLYSAGPDGKDDSGRFIAQPAAGETGYDLDLSWRNRRRAQ